jgi:hypothetical protein
LKIKRIVIKNQTIALMLGMVLMLFSFLFSQVPDTIWTRRYGGLGHDVGWGVQETLDGGYILVGATKSYGAGDLDVYLIKTDSNGDTSWTKTYGGTNSDNGWAVKQTVDGGYIVVANTYSFGSGGQDIYLIKTDSLGDSLWTRTYGDIINEWGYSTQQTSDSGYIIAGRSGPPFGEDDVYIIKTDKIGDVLWSKTYGGTQWEGANEICQINNDDYIVVGYTNSFGSGENDVFLIKLNSDGDTIWTRTYGGSSNDRGYSIKQTFDGGYIITGYSNSFGTGNADVYLIKTDESGDTLWTKTYGGSQHDVGRCVQQTSDSGYVIAGWTSSFGLDYDMYLIKVDSYGNIRWSTPFGGEYAEQAYSIQETSDGALIALGYTQSFDTFYHRSDFYLIKLKQEANIKENTNKQSILRVSCINPNPFKDYIVIKYMLTEKNFVNISIFNLIGQKIEVLVNKEINKGTYYIIWNSRNYYGKETPAGIYFLLFSFDNSKVIKKILKVR